MYPSDQTDTRQNRTKTENELAAFYAGTLFYIFYPIELDTDATQTILFTRQTNIILRDFRIDVTEGDFLTKIYRGGTTSGTWTDITVLPRNATTLRPSPTYASTSTVQYGGTGTGGTQVDQIRCKTSTATAQQQSVGGSISDPYGAPAGYGYYLITAETGGNAILRMTWEEIPAI